ncbi:DUF4352 domain-containing protein [Nocardia sp. CA-084685]|uniref:DUF4352 domain-containing protein n=1 Tax=Nocardia sp. CA-084685 TaxID=3239970 RepID=UPI003D950EB4
MILLLIIGGIILLCGVGAVAGTASKKAQPTPAAIAATNGGNTSEAKPIATTSVPPAPRLNTPVRDGKFEFVVTDVQSGMKTLGTNPYLQKTAQGSYTIVSLTVRNTSKVPYGFSPSDQYVFDAQNRKFGNDGTAAINLQADTSLYADINPGNSITAQMVFDLPADTEPDHIVLHDSMFSGGVTVSLR